MDRSSQLRQLLANLLLMEPDQIGAQTSLLSLNNSLGGVKLSLGLRRLGFEIPANFYPPTFGDLEACLTGERSPSPAPNPVPVAIAANGLQVGVDLQHIGALPEASDYWEHEFYRGVFAKSEIAHALVQPHPRSHLAGFWCAKEALRKCDPSFMGIEMPLTLVAHDPSGRPYLCRQSPEVLARLPHAVSISHSGDLVTAVVIVKIE